MSTLTPTPPQNRHWRRKRFQIHSKQAQFCNAIVHSLFSKLRSTPTTWSGPFRDHGLNPSVSTVTLCLKDFLCLLWILSRRPRAQGVPYYQRMARRMTQHTYNECPLHSCQSALTMSQAHSLDACKTMQGSSPLHSHQPRIRRWVQALTDTGNPNSDTPGL